MKLHEIKERTSPMIDFTTTSLDRNLEIDKIAQTVQDSVPTRIKLELEAIEKSIYDHPLRKTYFKVKGWVCRTLVTRYGTVQFKRRQYIERATNQSIFLLDKVCHLEKYTRLTQETIFHIAELAIECSSYAQAGRLALVGTIVSRQTVASCLDKVMTLRERRNKLIQADVLYISVDGFFANYKDFKKKKELKFASLYTGIESLTPTRKGLLNRTLVTPVKANQPLIEVIQKAIRDNFSIHGQTKIYILGDGAPWIKDLAYQLPNATFVIDPFHYQRAIQSLPDAPEIVAHIARRDRISLYHHLRLYMDPKDIRTMGYILEHFDSTLHWKDKDFIGCHAENVVSHYFNHRLRSKPRNWGRNLFKVASALADATSSSLKFTYTYDETFVNSIDELFTTTSNIPQHFVHNYNAPILNGPRTRLQDTIKGLLYGN